MPPRHRLAIAPAALPGPGPEDPSAVLRREAARDALALSLPLAATAAVVGSALRLGPDYLAKALLVFLLTAALVVAYAPRHGSGRRFGAANRVTLARAALSALLAALVGEPGLPGAAWIGVAGAALVSAMDALDGWLARRGGLASAFGARFDMETDALLVMVLSLLAWQWDKAGPWVLLSGLLRYLFAAAGALWPWMRRALPESRRRKTVCVAQTLALVVCLAPVVPAPQSHALAALALALLVYSFAVDTLWLVRRAGLPLTTEDTHEPSAHPA